MASPQLERGHTRLANELLEEIIAFPWSSSVQLRLVLHVVRNSYGFRRKKCRRETLVELAVALKEPRASVHRALQTLLKAGVLERDAECRLSLQKDYERWSVPVPLVRQKAAKVVPLVGQEARAEFSSEPVPPVGTEPAATVVPPVGNVVPPVGQVLSIGTERKPESKNNIQQGALEFSESGAVPAAATDPLAGFDEWYGDYPEKKARGAAERAWRKLKPDPELRAQIMAALAAQKRHRADARAAGEFVPNWAYPATWLNQQRWLDETKARPAASAPRPGAVKAPGGKYAGIGERHENA